MLKTAGFNNDDRVIVEFDGYVIKVTSDKDSAGNDELVVSITRKSDGGWSSAATASKAFRPDTPRARLEVVGKAVHTAEEDDATESYYAHMMG